VFEKFRHDTRGAVIRARGEAIRAGQDQLGCEHLLLGLLAEPGPAASAMTQAGLDVSGLRERLPRADQPHSDPLDTDALASVGIDLDQVRRAADAAFGPGALDRAARSRTRGPGRMRLTADASQALALARKAASASRHREITGAHVLLGIIDQGRNGALVMLDACAVDQALLRADVLSRLSAAA
jgi:ATP-dependent Clp protease ATP-binding subunit ClpA